MHRIFTLLALAASLTAGAQVVTTSPSPLQQGSPDVSVTFYADRGNRGLAGQPATAEIYAHTGVITNLSNGSWKYAPAWGKNEPKYQLEYVSPDVWRLHVGDIREYYGLTNPDEQVEQLAFVFRNASCSAEGKTATGGDIFVDVLPDGFQMSFTCDAPLALTSETATVSFDVGVTSPADIAIYLGSASEPIAEVSEATGLSTSHTFNPGTYTEVRAVAVNSVGGERIEKSVAVSYPGNSTAQAYPGGTPKPGATLEADGSVTFCLPAPGKHSVILVPSWADYKVTPDNVMHYTDQNGIRYFWTTVTGLDPAAEYPYYYLVDGSTAVGDPYARLVLDPYNDRWLSDGTYPGLIPYPTDKVEGKVVLAVYSGARDDYDWRVDNFRGVDPENLIVYELLLRDFTGTEGKARGDGTLALAMDKLDYLEELGVNAIELMPIQEFNGNNSWGYNTNFYFAPDKAYGSPDDYRAFIDECHSRGIAVILDVVFNQSDGLHPWYIMYPAGSNPFYNERAPHAYSVLNDWNQDNLLVQQQWTDMITYWMTAYRVDGFRFDLVKGLGDNESYGGNASEYNTNKYNASRIERMKRLTEVMHAINPYSYSINENLAGAQEENAMAANGQLNWANINHQSCEFAMGYKADAGLNRFYAPDDSRTWGSTVSYAESHDEQRVAYKQEKYGAAGIKGNLRVEMRRLGSMAAQMILAPGAHMIWQFGEMGNDTSTKNTNGSNNTDPKPVLWSYLGQPDRYGLMMNYRALNNIRNNNPDLFARTASYAMNCQAANWDAGRTIYASTPDGEKELICVINPTQEPLNVTGVRFKVADSGAYEVKVKSYDTTPAFNASTGQVTLDPGCFVVLTRGVTTGLDTVTAADMPGQQTSFSIADGRVIADDGTDVTVYTLDGRRAPNRELAPGIYLARTSTAAAKLLIH